MPNFWGDPFGFLIQWFTQLLASWGLPEWAVQLIRVIVGAGLLTVGALFFCIFLIWVERKIGGRVQDRIGPNRVGPFGLVQAIADMLKIFTKEFITPSGADKPIYNFAPVLAVGSVIMIWGVIPFTITFYGADLNVGILYIVAVGGLAEMAIVMAGWGSNNKYALLGAFRAVAQLLSYEVPMVISLLFPVLLSGSMKLNEIVKAQDVWFIFTAPIAALIFLISSIAENGRAPFDLMEAESELVSGFNVEYSGLKFGFFFVGDFLHAFTIGLLFSILFLGGWRGPWADQIPVLGFIYLLLKSSVVYFLLLLVRFSLPRFRIDQMMNINWRLLTPLALLAFMATILVANISKNGPWYLQAAILLLTNLLILTLSTDLFSNVLAKKPRRVVAEQPRPVARPDTDAAEPPAAAEGGS
jgi:NADH-quinone oxidoreductase subunit H